MDKRMNSYILQCSDLFKKGAYFQIFTPGMKISDCDCREG